MSLVPVVSLCTPNPRRVHYMDDDGLVLCGLPWQFRLFDDRRDAPIQECCPCSTRRWRVLASAGTHSPPEGIES